MSEYPRSTVTEVKLYSSTRLVFKTDNYRKNVAYIKTILDMRCHYEHLTLLYCDITIKNLSLRQWVQLHLKQI